jgi:hypothetical protein
MRRVVGSLILLLGVTMLAIGLHSGQFDTVMRIVRRVLEAAVAGAP